MGQRSRNKIDDNVELEDQIMPDQEEHDGGQDAEYPMSAHITDLDDLLGRDKRPIVWPPPQSPEPPEEMDLHRPEAAFSPSPPPPPVMSPSPVPPPLPQVTF